MWKLIANTVKSLQGNPSPGVLSTQERQMMVRGHINEVVNKHFGVYIEPIYVADVAQYSMRIMPDEAIEDVGPEYRESFIIGVNYMSRYIYSALDIEKVLNSFMDKPFNVETQRDLELIIGELMKMHEKMMNVTFVHFQTDVIINSINEKMFV